MNNKRKDKQTIAFADFELSSPFPCAIIPLQRKNAVDGYRLVCKPNPDLRFDVHVEIEHSDNGDAESWCRKAYATRDILNTRYEQEPHCISIMKTKGWRCIYHRSEGGRADHVIDSTFFDNGQSTFRFTHISNPQDFPAHKEVMDTVFANISLA